MKPQEFLHLQNHSVTRQLRGFSLLLLLLGCCCSGQGWATIGEGGLDGNLAPSSTGFGFRENKGQVSDQYHQPRPDVLFSGSDGGLDFHLKANGISYQMSKVQSWKQPDTLMPRPLGRSESMPEPDTMTLYRLDVQWLNAPTAPHIVKGAPREGYDNYYLAVCPDGVLGVKTYTEVTYQGLYDGIDLRWYQKDGHLKYDYEVAAGADYRRIQMEVLGADSIYLNDAGELVMATPLGDVFEQAPLVRQEGRILPSAWVVNGNRVGFEIAGVDAGLGFTIDPAVRLWGTYYGGSGDENGIYCATDLAGNVFLVGTTTSFSNIATVGAFQTVYAGINQHTFLVKFNALGVRQWGTYYNGSVPTWCTADVTGNIYFTAISGGSGLATAGSHQSINAGTFDAFIAKFDANGVRLWATYYGGSVTEQGRACATDANGNVFLAGYTNSSNNISTVGSHQPTFGGGTNDGFLVKFNSAGVRQWGTYFGGSGRDEAYACATDALGNVYLTGMTFSTNGIGTAGSYQPTLSGPSDVFVAKFNGNGVRQWSTYYGGLLDDWGYCCATDANLNVYLTGATTSTVGIASAGSHQPSFGGGFGDSYLAKFNSTGVKQWSTYYGGPLYEYGAYCSTDQNNNVFIASYTNSSTGIATAGGYQTSLGPGAYDAWLAKFDDAGVRLCATYYGGNPGGTGSDIAYACATDNLGSVYMTGYTNSASGLGSPGSHQPLKSGVWDAFLVKFLGDCIVLPNSELGILAHQGTICTGEGPKITVPIVSGNPTMTIDFPSANKTATAHQVGNDLVIDSLCFPKAGTFEGNVYVDGAFHCAITVTVSDCKRGLDVGVLPNPFQDGFTFTIVPTTSEELQLSIHDLFGKEIALLCEEPLASRETYRASFSPDVPSGIYFLQVRYGTQTQWHRIAKF